MSRIINGTLFVSEFDATLNPDEFTFTGAIYENQSDETGNGAHDLTVGFLLYIPAVDPSTFVPIPGVFNRYKLTAVDVVDNVTINGTVVWDETFPRYDFPQNSGYSIITESTAYLKYGLPASVGVYYNLGGGADIAAFNADIKNITDSFFTQSFIAGTGGIIKGRAVYKSDATHVIEADNSTQQHTAVIGIALGTAAQGDTVTVFKHAAVPSGIITASCFTENALPADGSWVFLGSANGKLTISAPLAGSGLWQTLLGIWNNGSLELQYGQWGIA